MTDTPEKPPENGPEEIVDLEGERDTRVTVSLSTESISTKDLLRRNPAATVGVVIVLVAAIATFFTSSKSDVMLLEGTAIRMVAPQLEQAKRLAESIQSCVQEDMAVNCYFMMDQEMELQMAIEDYVREVRLCEEELYKSEEDCITHLKLLENDPELQREDRRQRDANRERR